MYIAVEMIGFIVYFEYRKFASIIRMKRFLLQKLLKELITSCDSMIKADVVASAAEFEHRLNRGSKHIFHLEAFVASFMAIYKRHLEETMMGL